MTQSVPSHAFEDLEAELASLSREPTSVSGNSVIAAVAGPFTKQVEAVWEGRIGEYLAAHDGRRHLWHAWLSASPADAENVFAKPLLYSRLTFSKGRDLLLWAYGVSPPGALKVLSRLGTSARRPEVYQALMDVLRSEQTFVAKALRHCRNPSDDFILALAQLPYHDIPTARLLRDLAARSIPGDALPFVAWALKRLTSLVGESKVRAAVNSPAPMVVLQSLIMNSGFPAAPWPGNALLRPIDTEAKLADAGVELGNCLARETHRNGAILRVLGGKRYFYRWYGNEPALLSFAPLGALGWCLTELRGPANAVVSHATRGEIGRLLKEAEVLCEFPPENSVFPEGGLYWDY